MTVQSKIIPLLGTELYSVFTFTCVNKLTFDMPANTSKVSKMLVWQVQAASPYVTETDQFRSAWYNNLVNNPHVILLDSRPKKNLQL